MSCSDKKDTGVSSWGQGQRGTVMLSRSGVAQAPGKSCLFHRDSFHLPLTPNKGQAAGLQLHGGKTKSAQELLLHLCRLFQTTNGDVLMDMYG